MSSENGTLDISPPHGSPWPIAATAQPPPFSIIYLTAVSNADYMVLNEWMMVSNELERM